MRKKCNHTYVHVLGWKTGKHIIIIRTSWAAWFLMKRVFYHREHIGVSVLGVVWKRHGIRRLNLSFIVSVLALKPATTALNTDQFEYNMRSMGLNNAKQNKYQDWSKIKNAVRKMICMSAQNKFWKSSIAKTPKQNQTCLYATSLGLMRSSQVLLKPVLSTHLCKEVS